MSLRPHVTFDVASENDKLIPAILEPSQISFGHSLGWENMPSRPIGLTVAVIDPLPFGLHPLALGDATIAFDTVE